MSRGVVPVVLGACVVLMAPAHAFARAVVRFVHAVPSVGRVQLSLGEGAHGALRRVGSIGFGEASGWQRVPSGVLRWALSKRGHTLAGGRADVGDGAYDVVVLAHGDGVRLGIYRAQAGRAGSSLVRVIHAAPQLGSPALAVDGHTAIPRLGFTDATPYESLAPGHHTLAAERAAGDTPFLSADVDLRSGRSYSVIVVGSAGRRVRSIVLADRGAPAAVRVARVSSADVERSVLVTPGDSLWSIASRLSGPSASDAAIERRLVAIWDANEARIGTGDPNLIRPGTRLRV